MDVFETIRNRRSIRAYRKDPVPEESLARVLEAARLAPSAGNRQEHRFIVVKDESRRRELARAANNQAFVGDAPVVIVACATNPQRRYAFVDVAIAVDHMTLAAHAEGLGTCWIGAFSEPAVKEILGIPEEVSVVCLLPLGYPAVQGTVRPRKSAEELFADEKWPA